MPIGKIKVQYKGESLSLSGFKKEIKGEYITMAKCISFGFTKQQINELVANKSLRTLSPSGKRILYLKDDLIKASII